MSEKQYGVRMTPAKALYYVVTLDSYFWGSEQDAARYTLDDALRAALDAARGGYRDVQVVRFVDSKETRRRIPVNQVPKVKKGHYALALKDSKAPDRMQYLGAAGGHLSPWRWNLSLDNATLFPKYGDVMLWVASMDKVSADRWARDLFFIGVEAVTKPATIEVTL